MRDLTEADIHAGQIWRDDGTPHRWYVQSVVRDHLIGDIYETTVGLVNEFDARDTMRVPGSALLRDYELEPTAPVTADPQTILEVARQIEGSITAHRLQGDVMISLTASPQTWDIVTAALRLAAKSAPPLNRSETDGGRGAP